MIVGSVDIGSRNLSLSILDVEQDDINPKQFTFTLIKSIYIYLAADYIGDRLLVMKTKFEKEIEDNLIELLVFEDSKFAGKAAPDLHYVCGIVHLCGAQYQIPVKKLSPTAVKKRVTGVGTAGKAEVESAVKNILSNPPVSFETDHNSDSVAVGIAYFLK